MLILKLIALAAIESTVPLTMKKNLLQRKTTYGALIVIVVLSVLTLLSSQSSTALLHAAQNFIKSIGPWAPILFTILYIILGLIGFSTSALSFSAIVLFSPVVAFLCIMIGATLSAFLAFTIARSSKLRLAFPGAKRLSSHQSVMYVSKQIERQSKVHGFRLVLLLRLARLPYIALSYAAGFSPQITARNFVLATAFSNALSATALVVIGATAVAYFAVATVLLIGGFTAYSLRAQHRRSG